MSNETVFSYGVLVEQTIDHGDGTGTHTTFHPDGTVDTVTQLSGLPIPPPPELSPEERIAELEAALAAVSDDQAERMAAAEQARRDAYDAVLAGKTRTLTLVDQATKAGSVAFIGALQ